MVTDTAIIGRVADMCVYVCRADVTLKTGFSYINCRDSSPKLAILINDLDKEHKTTSYSFTKTAMRGRAMAMNGYSYGFESVDKKK